MKTTVMSILTITLCLIVSLAWADDMWSETPDLAHLSSTQTDFVEPATISNRMPVVDMWAETPDSFGPGEALDFQLEKVVLFKQMADPELYSETPDLDLITITPSS